ncbi:hypothetical protein [Pseudoprimorskyibacter insulae]|uniref:Flagellar FliJ protein n=1 Tax=Pseudoprimorskyibacter insulae TaxID=1695997 RepID=A0A2R8AYY9_9RHOB|nr:hypothetical protein [Pseudoprimorskyibacter insulae]SPF81220.1 hypothetical protein PRI8871_03042 [Pseudoprimorskyibacter insulae]
MDKLRELAALHDMLFDQEQARLAGIQNDRSALEAEAARLAQHARDVLVGGPTPLETGGLDVGAAWATHLLARRQSVQSALANARAEELQQKELTARSLARRDATRSLADQLAEAQKTTARRKAEAAQEDLIALYRLR